MSDKVHSIVAKVFSIPSLLRDLLSNPKHKIYLEDGDLIRIKRLTYKPSKVFITGSGITPRIFNITPSNRETLADVLFTSNF